MVSTVTNQGKLTFMVFQERFTRTVFLRFLGRLVRQSEKKVHLDVRLLQGIEDLPLEQSLPLNFPSGCFSMALPTY